MFAPAYMGRKRMFSNAFTACARSDVVRWQWGGRLLHRRLSSALPRTYQGEQSYYTHGQGHRCAHEGQHIFDKGQHERNTFGHDTGNPFSI